MTTRRKVLGALVVALAVRSLAAQGQRSRASRTSRICTRQVRKTVRYRRRSYTGLQSWVT